MRESTVQGQLRLEAADLNLHFWRNNVGACIDNAGRMIRYGLSNESAQINKLIKSSDLIGITPVQAYVEGIGWTVLGVFTAIETKHSDWKFSENDERAVAQRRFHNLVLQNGGFAGFATSINDMKRIVRR